MEKMMDQKTIKSTIEALNKELDPYKDVVDKLETAIGSVQELCTHERHTYEETRHGSYHEYYTCLDCGKKWST